MDSCEISSQLGSRNSIIRTLVFDKSLCEPFLGDQLKDVAMGEASVLDVSSRPVFVKVAVSRLAAFGVEGSGALPL